MSLPFLSSYPNRPTRHNITVFILKLTNKRQHYCLHTQTDQQETTLLSSYPNRRTRHNSTVFIPKQTNKRQHYCLLTQTDLQETTLLSSHPNRPTRDNITVFIQARKTLSSLFRVFIYHLTKSEKPSNVCNWTAKAVYNKYKLRLNSWNTKYSQNMTCLPKYLIR